MPQNHLALPSQPYNKQQVEQQANVVIFILFPNQMFVLISKQLSKTQNSTQSFANVSKSKSKVYFLGWPKKFKCV
jgi:hypothetical protein